MIRHHNIPASRPTGFTLVELLIAMGVLAIGLVSIAAIFPVSGYLQKQAGDDMLALHAQQHIDTMLKARKIGVTGGSGVFALQTELRGDTNGDGMPEGPWPVALRCYPSTYDLDGDGRTDEVAANVISDGQTIGGRTDPDTTSPDPEDADFDQRSIYWVPLGYDRAGEKRVYVFVLRSHPDAYYDNSNFLNGDTANPQDDDDDTAGPESFSYNSPSTYYHIPRVVRSSPLVVPGIHEPATNETYFEFGDTFTVDQLRPGDLVLFDNGVVARLSDVDTFNRRIKIVGNYEAAELTRVGLSQPTRVWFALPPQAFSAGGNRPDGANPAMRILVYGPEVIR